MRVPTKPLCAADISPVAEAAFWSRVQFDWRPGACWLWAGGVEGEDQRGRIKIDARRRAQANRVSYVLTHGPLAADEFACHTCDNPRCVRPDHLFAGTAIENIADRTRKDRGAKGSRAGTAILSESHVVEILADSRPHRVIAASFGVAKSTISKIKAGVNWRHMRAAA
jgi:hypothetical protein